MLPNEQTPADKRPLVMIPEFKPNNKELCDLWLQLGTGDLFPRLFHLSAIARTLHLALYHASQEEDSDAFGVVAEFLADELNKVPDKITGLLLMNGIVANQEKTA